MKATLVHGAVAGMAAVSLALGGAACGGGDGGGEVNKAALVSKFKSDPEFQKTLGGVPADVQDQFVNCLADVTLKYGNKDDLKAYVDGKKKANDIRSVNDKQAEQESQKCAEQAIGGQK